MFSDNKKEKTSVNGINQQNRIAEGTTIVGSITSEGGFRIDGRVEGDVKTKGKVVVGKSGKIEGSLLCLSADIEGSFKGILTVNGLLSLKSEAKIEGEVIIQKLAVEPGATFNASCSMGNTMK